MSPSARPCVVRRPSLAQSTYGAEDMDVSLAELEEWEQSLQVEVADVDTQLKKWVEGLCRQQCAALGRGGGCH